MLEELSQFHFAQSLWLFGILIVPIIWILYYKYYQNNANIKDLEKFIDKNLIPHLIRSSRAGQISIWRSLVLGSVLWVLLMAAMAGPRWNYTEFESYQEDTSLLILLDLSRSMDASDITPSRIIRARQEIEDILNLSNGIKIGVIGFAADAHIISPITDDINNIRYLLPLIGTDLIFVQGTRLVPAFKAAQSVLATESSVNKSVLLISDGGAHDDYDAIMSAIKDLANDGVTLHTLGIATEAGIKFVDDNSKPVLRDNKEIISKLEKDKLKALSTAGGGEYFDTHYSNKNAIEILKAVNKNSVVKEQNGKTIKRWDEKFYIFLFPIMIMVLLWFRKGFAFPIILLVLLTPANNAHALNKIDKLFLNEEQYAKKVFEETEDVEIALKTFKDPYKRGVAYYRAGRYKEAEQEFRKNQRPEVMESSLLNLANALAKQDKFEESVDTYRNLLQKNPKHPKALHNMKLVRGLIFVLEEEEDEEECKERPPPSDGDKLGGGGGGGGGDEEEDEGGGGDKNEEEGSDEGDDDEDKNEDEKGGDKGDEDANPEDGDNDEADQDKGDKSDKDKAPGNAGDGDDKSEAEIDQLLDLIANDHKNFLKNQFLIESQKNNTQPTNEPW